MPASLNQQQRLEEEELLVDACRSFWGQCLCFSCPHLLHTPSHFSPILQKPPSVLVSLNRRIIERQHRHASCSADAVCVRWYNEASLRRRYDPSFYIADKS